MPSSSGEHRRHQGPWSPPQTAPRLRCAPARDRNPRPNPQMQRPPEREASWVEAILEVSGLLQCNEDV